ncbi:YtzH-like family protein [Bacillus sp. 2205SS5-2]|uniref:YtzH-like family protein n=1 Tax=Bacillus sp. 2205SS5-2 TaxID=3109031 RepID=UPI003004821D
MPLNQQNQMDLLTDILNNHLTDCCGSVAECEQVERLVKSLMVNGGVNHQVKSALEEIYKYSQEGKGTHHLNEHIQSHQENLQSWVNDVNSLT